MSDDGSVSSPRTVRALQGDVIEAPFAVGSKSERNAICLQTCDQRYVLRRRHGPSMDDATLVQFVGHRVECDGTIVSYLLLVDRIDMVS